MWSGKKYGDLDSKNSSHDIGIKKIQGHVGASTKKITICCKITCKIDNNYNIWIITES